MHGLGTRVHLFACKEEVSNCKHSGCWVFFGKTQSHFSMAKSQHPPWSARTLDSPVQGPGAEVACHLLFRAYNRQPRSKHPEQTPLLWHAPQVLNRFQHMYRIISAMIWSHLQWLNTAPFKKMGIWEINTRKVDWKAYFNLQYNSRQLRHLKD